MTDLTHAELSSLFRVAKRYKHNPMVGATVLARKVVALVFQKPSMRTRVAFEVAVLQLGGSVVYLGQDDIQLGQREPIKDVARVLSTYVDAIVTRTFLHQDVEEFSAYAQVPVINGLSDLLHPCQALADLLTIEEYFGRLKGLKLAYVGDGNNVLHSLLHGCAMTGIDIAVATPPAYRPHPRVWNEAQRLARVSGATLRWAADPQTVVQGADVVYTDVWVSMGQERERATRRTAFRGYQLTAALLRRAATGYRVMHCLPAHRGEEITDEVMEGPHALIFQQAENRLHAQKALLTFLMGEGGVKQKLKLTTQKSKPQGKSQN